MVDRLAIFAASPNHQLLPHRPDCAFQYLHHPCIHESEGSWKAIPNNENNCNEPLKPEEIISIENNKIHEGSTLESSFSLSVVGNKGKQEQEELRKKVIETIPLNIRTPEPSMNVKTNVQCFDKEEMGSTELLGESQKIFSWYYEDLCDFNPGLVQDIMKLARQK